jgi:hypothetical protein
MAEALPAMRTTLPGTTENQPSGQILVGDELLKISSMETIFACGSWTLGLM